MRLKELHNKLTQKGFSLVNARSSGGYAMRNRKGDATGDVNEITSWLDDDVLEVTIKTGTLPHPIKCLYTKG